MIKTDPPRPVTRATTSGATDRGVRTMLLYEILARARMHARPRRPPASTGSSGGWSPTAGGRGSPRYAAHRAERERQLL
jgi:hypothetical protein